MIVDRYASHGLRSNPFAVPHPDAEHQAVFVDRGLRAPPPPASGVLVQVIGDKGAGKSTQVREWQRRTPGPYHYVPATPYRDRWSRPPVGPLVYADEIDRMPAALRRRWFRSLATANATVIAGTHVDLQTQACAAGLAVRTHRLDHVDLATVEAVLAGKVALASDATPQTFELTRAEIADVHQRCGGSLRTAELLAHELIAERVRCDPEPIPLSPTKVRI